MSGYSNITLQKVENPMNQLCLQNKQQQTTVKKNYSRKMNYCLSHKMMILKLFQLVVVLVIIRVGSGVEAGKPKKQSWTGHTLQLINELNPRNVTWDALYFKTQVDILGKKELEVLKRYGVFEKLASQDRVDLLDIGCGPGYFSRMLILADKTKRIHITCMDVDAEFNSYAEDVTKQLLDPEDRPRLKILNGNIFDTQLPNESFDIVTARFIFQHIRLKRKMKRPALRALKELNRVLKPDGILIAIDSDSAYADYIFPTINSLEYIGDRFFHFREKFNDQIPKSSTHSGISMIKDFKDAGLKQVSNEPIFVHSDEFKDGIKRFVPLFHPYNYYSGLFFDAFSEDEYEEALKDFEDAFIYKTSTKKEPQMVCFVIATIGKKTGNDYFYDEDLKEPVHDSFPTFKRLGLDEKKLRKLIRAIEKKANANKVIPRDEL